MAYNKGFAQTSQEESPAKLIPCSEFHITKPLSEIFANYKEDADKNANWISEDKENRKPQKFRKTVKDGAEYGNDKGGKLSGQRVGSFQASRLSKMAAIPLVEARSPQASVSIVRTAPFYSPAQVLRCRLRRPPELWGRAATRPYLCAADCKSAARWRHPAA